MSTTNRPFSKLRAGRGAQGLQSRRTSLLVAVISALLAAALIYLFVSREQTTPAPAAPVVLKSTVWVAKAFIPQGTPYAQVVGQLQHESIQSSQAVAGAIADPAAVAGQVLKNPVAAGQQLTAADFSATAKPSLGSYLKHDYRAVAFPLDAAHGLTAYLKAGLRVDVMGQSGATSTLLAQNVEVIANASGNVILRLTDKQSLLMTAASGKDKLWLSLRPTGGATQTVKLGDEESL